MTATTIKTPGRILGEWIWKKSLLNHPDAFLMLRKEFICNFVGLETNLWISANSAYQLFINGRFVGFGPRAHQSCGTSYMDLHEVTYCLEPGINVIAVLVYRGIDPQLDNKRAPGLWCQMESQGKDILCTDHTWSVREGSCFMMPRARVSRDQGLTHFIDAAMCPYAWMTAAFLPDSTWHHVDYVAPVGAFGTALEAHPLPPPSIAVENPVLLPFRRGKITRPPRWTQVTFENSTGNGEASYAADTFLYSDIDRELPVRLFADDPYKLFCNNRLVADETDSMKQEAALPLRTGWNRLLLVQDPCCNGMGLYMLLPEAAADAEEAECLFRSAPSETAAEGWNTVGPLKLSRRDATPSLGFDRLHPSRYTASLDTMTDPDSYLAACTFEAEPISPIEEEAALSWTRPLKTGDYVIYKLDMVRYGFVRFTLEAAAEDVVDITVGCCRTSSGFVIPCEGARGTRTLRCRNGKSIYLAFVPDDCCYVMVSVRHTARAVRVIGAGFDELVRHQRNETLFHCSDELLNQFWETGRQTLRRSAAFVPMANARAENDCYLLDAYIDAVNMAAVFGDYEYASARLGQFVDAQLENGDIPALTFGSRHVSQIHQLFFFPVWIHYNYRFSANITALKSLIPSLDLTRAYFEAMIDDQLGLLTDVEVRFGLHQPGESPVEYRKGEVPTYLNALFCRFLLSSAEIYRTVEEPAKAEQCLILAGQIAERLRAANFDPVCSLFCRWGVESEPVPDHNLFANFCAMYGGVLPLESFEYFFHSFFEYEPPYDRSSESRHPYFHFLFMEMMFALGQREWAYDYFRSYWQERLCADASAWRRGTDRTDPAPIRFADGNCVSPNIFLLREVLGIRIAEAGHSVIYFNPAFRQVRAAEGVFPMARGRLKVKWELLEDGTLDVTLDSTAPVKILPEMSHRQLAETVFRLGVHVTLLNPTSEYDEEEKEPEPSGELSRRRARSAANPKRRDPAMETVT